MSYNRKIIRGEDFKRALTYLKNRVGQNLTTPTNYAVVLVYKDVADIPTDGEREICYLSRNAVAATPPDYEAALTDNDEANGKFNLNVRREITADITEGAKIDAIFYKQVATTPPFTGSIFRPCVKFPLGTAVSGLTTSDLTT